LNHAGEIALQRFHRHQIKGKNSLNEEELYVVIKNAFSFLSSISKEKVAIGRIFARINTNSTVGYASYLNWIRATLSSKFHK